MLFASAIVAFFAFSAPVLAQRTPVSKGTLGSACRFSSQCKEVPTGARPSCNKRGVCDFVCLNGPILVKNKGNDGCVPNPNLKRQCRRDSECDNKVKFMPRNAEEYCLYGQCAYRCVDGYHKIAGKCFKNQGACGGNDCAPIQNGSTFCGTDNQCVYRCNQAAGFTLYTNSDRSAYRCINTGSDENNCGAAGNTCDAPYNGIGSSVCLSGTCSVDCTGNGRRLYNSQRNVYYCSGADSA